MHIEKEDNIIKLKKNGVFTQNAGKYAGKCKKIVRMIENIRGHTGKTGTVLWIICRHRGKKDGLQAAGYVSAVCSPGRGSRGVYGGITACFFWC